MAHDPARMRPPPVTPIGARPETQRLALGAGWAGPAVLLAVLLSAIYLPAHAGNASAADRIIATIAALYVLGFSVALVRIARGAVLRLGGSHEPIVLLGSGADALVDPRIRPRWRLSAVAAGAIVASGVAFAAALVAESVPATTYAHALANLALMANLVLVGGVLLPTPGSAGWALVLAIVDSRGSTADTRVRMASRVAQAIGVPCFVAIALLAGLVGDVALMVVSVLAVIMIRTRCQWAVGHDAIARFLAGHLVGDFARPIDNRADEAEPLAAVARRAGAEGVTAIEAGGALIGAVGPRQLARQGRAREGERVGPHMVALADIQQLSAANPATGIVPAMARHGFAFVRGPRGLGWVEADDVLAQILEGLAAASGGPEPPASAGSGPLCERQCADDDDHETGRHRRQG